MLSAGAVANDQSDVIDAQYLAQTTVYISRIEWLEYSDGHFRKMKLPVVVIVIFFYILTHMISVWPIFVAYFSFHFHSWYCVRERPPDRLPVRFSCHTIWMALFPSLLFAGLISFLKCMLIILLNCIENLKTERENMATLFVSVSDVVFRPNTADLNINVKLSGESVIQMTTNKEKKTLSCLEAHIFQWWWSMDKNKNMLKSNCDTEIDWLLTIFYLSWVSSRSRIEFFFFILSQLTQSLNLKWKWKKK